MGVVEINGVLSVQGSWMRTVRVDVSVCEVSDGVS